MGSKNKLKRFKENETFPNVIQPTREEVLNNFTHKGKWHSFFKNSNPIIIELGCGKGEYTIALAEKNPDKNFIGIDIKGARFWRGAKTALEEGLSNVEFLKKYHHILKEDGIINLKTDSEFMHGYTLGLLHGEGHEILHANHNVYKNDGAPEEVTSTQTFYEKQYLEVGKPITYIQFKLNF